MAEKILIDVLRSKPGGDKLSSRLDDIKSEAIPLLNKIGETFSEYTLHDISHSENVIGNFDLIIPDILKEKLNIYEIYFLIASAYLHDIGMVNFPKIGEDCEKNAKEDLAEYIRNNHHFRSEEFIVKNYKEIKIGDPHQAEIIGRICRGHRKENLFDTITFDPNLIYKSYPINVALSSSLLRIADELDLTFERAPLIVYEHVPPRTKISNDEWKRHLKITGVAKHPEDSLIIKCSARCENLKIHRALMNLEVKINNELDDLVQHLHQYKDCRREIPRKFLMDIKAIDYKYHDFRFSLQEKEIINLLMGDKLYINKNESLRELLKNSVDACRFRRDELKKQGLYYEPKITFRSVPDKHKIIVEDNGLGMDEYVIESHFTKIGRSFYKSEQFLKSHHDFEPVGELGIGVLSYFMIADKVTIETATYEHISLIIEIDNVSDYFFVREGNRKVPGTIVTLDLNEKFEYDSLVKIVRSFATHMEFPIEVIDLDGKQYIIKDKISFPLVLDGKNLKILALQINNEQFSGHLGVLVSKNKRNPFAINIGQIIGFKQNFISLEGILVSNDNTTNELKPNWITPSSVVFDINLKKTAIDLNVARNKLIENNKLNKFKTMFEQEMIKALAKLFDKIRAKSDITKKDFSSIMYYFFKYYITNTFNKIESGIKDTPSDNFIEFAKLFCHFKCFNDEDEGLCYLNYEDIIEKDTKIILLRDLNEEDDDYLLEIIENVSVDSIKNSIIIADEKDGPIVDLCKMLFNITSMDFVEIFGENWSQFRSSKLNSIFSDLHNSTGVGYFLFEARSYYTRRFVEYASDDEIVFNENNIFLKLIHNYESSLSDEITIFLLNDFFSDLIKNNNYNHILSKQKTILRLFVEKHIINNADMAKYELTLDDFPPSFFNISFSIYL